MIPTVTFEEAEQLVIQQQDDWHIVRIDAGLDVEWYKDLCHETRQNYKLIKKDGYDTYQAIGLQHSEGAEDELYDSVQASASIDGKQITNKPPRSFVKINELGMKFKGLIDMYQREFSKLQIFRTRILVSKPLHLHAVHTDERGCRLHFPVQTHKHAIMWFGDDPYHMRADGSLYLCNTGKVPHNFGNLQRTVDRVHIVCGLGAQL